MDLKTQIHSLVLANHASKYICFFDEIFLAKEEKEIFNIFKRYNLKKEKYFEQLEKLNIKFPNHLEEIEYLKDLYIKYDETYLISKEKSRKTTYKKSIVTEILESGYSLEEYCLNNGLSISQTYLLIRNNKLYKKVSDELNSRSTEKIDELIKNLVYSILYEDMDILEYFKITSLDLNDLLRLSKKIITSDSDKVKIATFVRDGLSLIRMSVVNKEREMNSFSSFNGHQVTTEEKEIIFNYLEENNIPLKLYHYALKKYLNGNLDIEFKTKR